MSLNPTTTALTTLAEGPGVLPVLIPALVGAAIVTMAILTYRRHRKERSIDKASDDLDATEVYLKEMLEKLCENAQQPCSSEDVSYLRKRRHLIDESASQWDVIRSQLAQVVRCIDVYLGKEIPEAAAVTDKYLRSTKRASIPADYDIGTLLKRAMEQESARVDCKAAIATAQQTIRARRKG
ncbi:hypothetical protein ACFYXH_09905 [Streptomyces sp. NPDC002730]|uniref:hypothetical protein n=1 Tax=Streptomyces sp. NPDC002730 TaxID=3364662 RepID=UPI0036BF480C